jgi:hypothetical protein
VPIYFSDEKETSYMAYWPAWEKPRALANPSPATARSSCPSPCSHQVPLDVIRGAVTRESDGSASTIVGKVADQIGPRR